MIQNRLPFENYSDLDFFFLINQQKKPKNAFRILISMFVTRLLLPKYNNVLKMGSNYLTRNKHLFVKKFSKIVV